MTKVYVTKWAMSKGIKEMEGELVGDGFFKSGYIFLNKSYYSLNREDAVKKCEEMRIKKILSLERKIKKLQQEKY